MRFRTFLGGIALATSLSWFLGMSVNQHMYRKPLYPAQCNYCSDDTEWTHFEGHEPGCPDSLHPAAWPQPLIDGMPECEAR